MAPLQHLLGDVDDFRTILKACRHLIDAVPVGAESHVTGAGNLDDVFDGEEWGGMGSRLNY